MASHDFSPAAATSISAILSGLAATAAARPDRAPLMPPGAFHSPEFLRLEMERLFSKHWVCVGRTDDFSASGSYVATSVAEVPVLVVRQDTGGLKGFVNACAHRRAQIVPESRGRKTRFVCPYHAWTYGPDGALVGAPYMSTCAGFDRAAISLRPVQLDIWEGFVFVSLSEDGQEPLTDRLLRFTADTVGHYRMERYRTIIHDELDYAGNWKNIIENFMESYHVFAAHRNTFALTDKTPDDYECGPDLDWCSFHTGLQKGESGQGAAHPNDMVLEGEWRRRVVVACVFPGLLISLTPDLLWYVTVQPAGIGRFKARWGAAVPQEFLDDVPDDAREAWIAKQRRFMDAANEEDKPLIEALYRGTASANPPPGLLHPIEKNIWDFARYLDRQLNAERYRAAKLAAE